MAALVKTEEDVTSLLPAKSSSKYWREYEVFMKWCHNNSVDNYNEEFALLPYFEEKSKTVKYSTLWSLFSMLKATLNIKHNINIETYTKLIAFLESKKDGYVPVKTKTLKTEEFEKFITEAPDEDYLMIKAALIIGMCAACRSNELVKMSIQDLKDRGDVIIVQISDTKTEKPRTACITEPHWIDIVRKYINLRPPESTRLFLYYSKNKCTKQPVGIHSFGSMPSKVATFLNLDNPKQYTGHCFRRSSASVLAGGDAHITTPKRSSRWRSKMSSANKLADRDSSRSQASTSSTNTPKPSSSTNYKQLISSNAHNVKNRWTVNQIEALINQYKKYPVLYNTDHEEYLNLALKSACLANIVEALQGVRSGVTDAHVTSQWNNLMVKYFEAIWAPQAKDSETAVNWEPQFWYLDKLQFLQEHMGSIEIKLGDCGTVEYEETKLFDPQIPTETHEWKDAPSGSSLQIKQEIEDSPPTKIYKYGDSESSENGTSPEDEYDIFGKLVASQLRKITDDEVRQDTIFEFHKLLYKALKKK